MKLWSGRFGKETDALVNDFNASIQFDQRLYKQDIAGSMIKAALLDTVKVSFNRISVDGDTSTNDTCCVLANGLAGNPEITEKNADYEAFTAALKELCTTLARKMASDGEGAKHLITCTVEGAASEKSAEVIGKSVISSTLTKAAIFGADANWGRVLCAMPPPSAPTPSAPPRALWCRRR
jgi:N-acetylglutamate synthase (N-acetylornithine aminotransferase)